MLVGKTRPGASAVELGIDTKRVARFTFPAERVPKLSAYLDGLGAGSGDTLLRPLIYSAAGALLARGDEIIVPDGSPAAWYDLRFSSSGAGVYLPVAGDYDVGLHVGGSDLSGRVWRDDPDPPGGKTNADAYADGASDPFGASSALTGRFAVFTDTFLPWTPPPNEFEMVLARLPFLEAQAVFSQTPPVAGTARRATLTFHGTGLDIERGSFAIVSEGGAFADWIGERIQISTQGAKMRSVYAYVHNSSDVIDGDLSVSRRLFYQLTQLGLDKLTVTVARLS